MKKFRSFIFSFIFLFSGCANNYTFAKNLCFSENFSDIKNLDIELSFENLEITEIHSNTFSVEIYCNDNTIIPTVEESNNSLNIQTKDSLFKIWNFVPECKVCLFIPSDFVFDDTFIKSSSGNISIASLNCKNTLELNSSSGTISAEYLTADKAYINSSSGSIKLSSLKAEESNISSSSGSLTVTKLISTYSNLKSTSGKINVLNLQNDYFDASSTSGSIFLDISKNPLAQSKIHSTSGSVTVHLKNDFNLEIVANCTSGTINKTGRRSLDYSIGTNGPVLDISTTSGSINFQLN